MTSPEVNTLLQTIGGLKRGKRTIENASLTLSQYEDRAKKNSKSGMLLDAGLKALSTAGYWLDLAIDMLDSARNDAKEVK